MKKLFAFTLALLTFAVLPFTMACGNREIIKMYVNVDIYEGGEFARTTTLTYDLYRHLAPKSVDAVTSLAKSGYYNGSTFYRLSDASGSVMFGGYRYDQNGNLLKDAEQATLEGEFAKGGTIGSPLKADQGNLLLWRWWNAGTELSETGYQTGSAGMLMIPQVEDGTYTDAQNSSTLLAVAGTVEKQGESYKALRWVLGTASDEVYANWDNAETFYAFYLVKDGALITEDGQPKCVILSGDDYETCVVESVYTPAGQSGEGGAAKDTFTVYNPAENAVSGYESVKYATHRITAPSYAYRLVVKSVTF